MPPLPGWDHPVIQRRRQAVRATVASLVPAPARRAASTAATARAGFTRVGLWLAIGALVVLFGMATDGTRVAVVAIPAAVAAVAWRQLSWLFRAVIVVGLLWLSLAELDLGLGLGLDALLVAWWWLPTQTGGGATETPAATPDPELANLAKPLTDMTGYDLPFSGHLPVGLRRFAEERHLPEEELAMLASIRFPGEPPRTAARWQHIYNAIRLSRWLDKEDL